MKIRDINAWWNVDGCGIRDFLPELSGDNLFHKKLHISDAVNVHDYVKAGDAPSCSDAESVVAARHGLPAEALYDTDGCYHTVLQDEYNRLYDRIEERMMYFKDNNQK